MYRRNVTYHSISLGGGENMEEIWNRLKAVLDFIMELDQIQRKREIPETEKFVFLFSESSYRADIIDIVFKSAKCSYRAPLIDSSDLTMRDNPKRLTEGEQIKTHLVLKKKDDIILCLLESGESTLTIKQIMFYINSFLGEFNHKAIEALDGSFYSAIIARDDFEKVLNDSDRVMSVQLKVKNNFLDLISWISLI